MSTFVQIPADRLLSRIEEIGQKIKTKGGTCTRGQIGAEILYEITLPPSERRAEFIDIKICTSIAQGASEARDCGRDAIRIMVGSISTGEFKPLRGITTIKRTAPNNAADRVGAFLERFTDEIRDAYRFGLKVPVCACGHHMAERDGKNGKFWGCTAYPACRGTKNI